MTQAIHEGNPTMPYLPFTWFIRPGSFATSLLSMYTSLQQQLPVPQELTLGLRSQLPISIAPAPTDTPHSRRVCWPNWACNSGALLEDLHTVWGFYSSPCIAEVSTKLSTTRLLQEWKLIIFTHIARATCWWQYPLCSSIWPRLC